MSIQTERRLLQATVALLACVPVSGGLAGILLGGSALGGGTLAPGGDSHLRYLSGLLLAIGVAFWATVPGIEQQASRFRLLSVIVIVGGCCRFLALIWLGLPGAKMLAALGMELGVMPLLLLWRERVELRSLRCQSPP